MWPSISTILTVLFMGWLSHSMWTIYNIYNPSECDQKKETCLKPAWKSDDIFQLFLCTSLDDHPLASKLNLVERISTFKLTEPSALNFQVKLPTRTLNNGSLYLHAFLTPMRSVSGVTAELVQSKFTSHAVVSLTKYTLKQAEAFNLLSKNQDEKVKKVLISKYKPISHWKPKVIINIAAQPYRLKTRAMPEEIVHLIKLNPRKEYLPIIYISELRYRIKELWPINSTVVEMPLELSYEPTTIGKLRFMRVVEGSIDTMRSLGFTDFDTDDVKGIFFDTNLYLLLLTVFITSCHMLFDFLAFKSDIQFWRSRNSMAGLSFSTLTFRCISQFIITLYLFDQQTSLIVLVPAGIGFFIEIWKLKKALKVTIKGFRFEIGKRTKEEEATDLHDANFMKQLSKYVLIPLVIMGAIYSLLYTEHKSWYSWVIQSAANGVYAFGFLFMLPQLFINYKLKSVAHLPWRAFMYKAFNTFIDDLFAFLITSIPTSHRLAAFRDDVVFIIYLYQRWLYPVDKTRLDEFAEPEEEKKNK